MKLGRQSSGRLAVSGEEFSLLSRPIAFLSMELSYGSNESDTGRDVNSS